MTKMSNKGNAVKPTHLNLGEEAYYIDENLVDNEERVSQVKWYDVKSFTVKAMNLGGTEVTITGEVTNLKGEREQFESDVPIDSSDFFLTKEAAVEEAFAKNEKEQKRNSKQIQEAKNRLQEIEDEKSHLERLLEAGRKVDDTLNKWMEKAANGEIYKDD